MCPKCKKQKSVYRTNPIGSSDAGWLCIDCIEEIDKDRAEKITEEFGDIVHIIEQANEITEHEWSGLS